MLIKKSLIYYTIFLSNMKGVTKMKNIQVRKVLAKTDISWGVF